MKKKIWLIGLGGVVLGIILTLAINAFYARTSASDYCMTCHIHPESDSSWKMSKHCINESGTKTDCAECHLPPQGTFDHFKAKTCTGIRDIWAYWTKDKEEFDWDSKSDVEYAKNIVYNESCKECHVNLLPTGITDDGITAHLYYQENETKLNLQCISCHLDAGHYDPNYKHASMTGVVALNTNSNLPVYDSAAEVSSFASFTETVPGTTASINMIAVPGGSFLMGSDPSEAFHQEDEGPQHEVTVSRFFMSEVEVTWNQYWAFYNETMSEGRTPPEKVYANNSRPDVDAVSGPTPPFGNPDQGWGQGDRPAITMTHYAAQTFCQWLSLKTGRTYRLPTEAEWEYAARGGTQTPYFFEGNPKKYSSEGFLKGIFKPDTTVINGYAIYALNSRNRTQEPSRVKANPFGLKNMVGNVLEYCSDWYAADAYASLKDGVTDPKGPAQGTEHVVRGGLYNDDAAQLRSAARSHTRHDAWIKTDPQNPKSIWWYSDIKGIGFRIVCEVPAEIQ